MPLIRTRIDISSDFPRITRDVNELAQRAVTVAATEGARVASAVAGQRSKSGQMAAMRLEPVRGSADGWEASFVSPVHYAWFQNYGTLGNRRRRLKRAPRGGRTRALGSGIAPLGFLDAGRRAGRAALLRTIASGL